MSKKTRTWKVVWIDDGNCKQMAEIKTSGDAYDALGIFMNATWPVVNSIERIYPVEDVWGTYGS